MALIVRYFYRKGKTTLAAATHCFDQWRVLKCGRKDDLAAHHCCFDRQPTVRLKLAVANQ